MRHCLVPPRIICILFLGVAFSLSSWRALAESAAHIEFVIGNVLIADAAQQTRSAAKGASVNVGETVITNEGRAQLRFSDGGHFSLQPQSQFRVDAYRFAGNDDKEDRVFLTLLKGGLRTISGLIGKRNRPAYKLGTSMATIGIRGTEYVLDLNASLYGHVAKGAVEVCNGAGCLSVPGGKAFFVSSPSVRPVLTDKRAVLAPPSKSVTADVALKSDNEPASTTLSSSDGPSGQAEPVKAYSAQSRPAVDFVLPEPRLAQTDSDNTTGRSLPVASDVSASQMTPQPRETAPTTNSSARPAVSATNAQASGSNPVAGNQGISRAVGQTLNPQAIGQLSTQRIAAPLRSQTVGAGFNNQPSGNQIGNNSTFVLTAPIKSALANFETFEGKKSKKKKKKHKDD